MSAPTEPSEPAATRTAERTPAELSTTEAWLDPFDWYVEMREHSPVRYDESRDCFDVFRYDDVDRILHDPETFSSDPRNAPGLDLPPEEERSPLLETMLSTDAARHDRLRGVVEEWFRPRALAGRRERLESVAAGLLDDAVAGGEMDVIDEFAYPFPVIVIAELLGVPSDERPTFRRWSETLVEAPDGRTPEAMDDHRREQQRVSEELSAYFEEKLDARAVDRRGDLITVIADAEAAGELSRTEALGFCMLLLVAGNITTTNLIGNAVRCLTAHPEALARAERGDARLEPLIEEVLRYRSPVQALARFATEEVEIAGETVAEGDVVVPWIGSANRDPAAFDAPDEFRIDRAPNQHLGFGRGTHYCLGAPLARLETEIALTGLFDRATGIERATDELVPVRSAFIYGVTELPVEFERRA
ncbi:cytochrome P450 [Halobaculum lipolyticum]|uniref:Cytochrome P450 n=1 Tax=Halobaculum lipolyticum TaxID=3032001 RepID=A0ABD5WA82_9EURY|nr:cytochrome P450 [Halobaculum sp. DT31]